MTQRIRVHIQGIVQGVGFRPFIYQLAHRHRLNGYVTNTPKGVELEVEGGRDALNHFLEELPKGTMDKVLKKELRKRLTENQ